MPLFCPHCLAQVARGAMVVTRKGKAQPRFTKPPQRPNARQRIWRSMQVGRRFTVPDLVATAEAGTVNVRRFVNALVLIGYVRLIRPSTFEAGDHAVYQLIRHTGPHAPRLRTDGTVFDLNTQEVVRG